MTSYSLINSLSFFNDLLYFERTVDNGIAVILEKVLAKPIEPIESEENLFNNEPLFEEKKDKGKYLWIPQVIAVVAFYFFKLFFSGLAIFSNY